MRLSSVPQTEHTLFTKSAATPRLLSYTPTGSYYNEVQRLNPPQLDLLQHLQAAPAAPAPLDRPPAITIGELSEHFQGKLADSSSARQDSLQKLRRQLLVHTGGKHDPANLDRKQAKTCYQYFKAAQQAFDELARTGDEPRRGEYREQRDLCRMLKWQYRASRDQRDKTVLDQAMAKSRAAVAEGGSMGNHTRLGIGVGMGAGALGMASFVPSVELSTGLSTTQGRIIKDTTSVSAGVTAKLSANVASAQVGMSFEQSTIRKYGSIDAYVDARSRSKWTWWNGSKRDMLTQSRNLFASCNHYKRNIRLAAQSQPCLENKLRENGLGSPGFEQHPPKAQPFQIERGQRFALTGSAQFDGLGVVKLGAGVKAEVLHTTKSQALDIIGLYDWSPDVANMHLDSPPIAPITAQQLISDLNRHVSHSSEQLSNAVLNNQSSQERQQLGEKLDSRSRELANQYIHLKNDKVIADGDEHDKTLRQLFKDHAMLLRPGSLKIHTAKADTRTTSVSVEAKLKVAAGASAELGGKLTLSSVEDDDPHLSGTFLDITLNGQFNTLESLQNLVASGLDKVGVNNFDPAPIVALVAGTALYQAHGVAMKYSLKMKDGEPVLLLQQKFFTQTDNVNQTIDTPIPLTAEVGFGSHVDTLITEELGTRSLEPLLPLALAKLGKRTEEGMLWWDGYVDKHAESMDKLLQNIANGGKKTLIIKELAEIRGHISPARQHVVEDLVSAARKARDEPDDQTLHQAREALKAMFFTYIDDYYDKEVKKAWRVE